MDSNDINDPELSTEFDDELQRRQRNEVVPSSETSISDNELTTTIAEHKQSPVDVPSNGTNSGVENQLHTLSSERKVFETNVIEQESDGGGSTAGIKSESDTESESRLVIQSENETTDNDTASTLATTTIKENGGTSSSAKRKSTAKINNKQKKNDINDYFSDGIEFSDDDEKFMGFTDADINKCTSWAPSVLLKRIKTNSPSIPNQPATTINSIEEKVEQKTPQDVTMNEPSPPPPQPPVQTPQKPVTTTTDGSSPHIIKTDPRYRNPFKFGWRREVVFRANMSAIQKSDNKGEVYYHSPSGKKLRTKNEIMKELVTLKESNLDIGDFTFAKESVGMPPEQEIVRSAKVQTPSQKRQPVPVPESTTPEILGKRIPKPKMPKGASPPPPSITNKSRTPIASNKRQPEREIIEVIQPKAPKTNSKSKSRPHTPVAGSKSNSSRRSSPSLPVANNAYASTPLSVHSMFASEFFNNVSRGYDILFNIFQYLKVQELVRVSSVCRMWNHVANNSILWQTIRMKNSQANDWAGLMAALRRHGTRHLDLRKILIAPTLDWNDFITHISRTDLETLHLCRCPSEVVTALLETNTNLRALMSLSITGNTFTFPSTCRMSALQELRLKSGSTMKIENLQALQHLTSLRQLSLTSIDSLDANQLEPLSRLASLESLELGECNNLAGGFARNILNKLRNLERLRLEGGKGCATFDILEVIERLPKLIQLELVNFDIKPGFDTRIALCRRLKRLLIIPTYISQSATTNNLVLSSIAHLGDTLQSVTWVVTQELIRVTDLYTDECHTEGQPRKPNEDKIPIIKPVPMMRESQKSNTSSDASTQLVEILPLSQVEKIIRSNIPKLKLKIQKVPFSATWRQTISDTS
ncbi:uncharacterized protein LOC116346640 isoform X3 [Contarinia nasturtii]|uniref:uncharacterized protein LOC116346640 isoform X3 n=1 Tax=Contarinia nasturtii TaxID=265458 RepID=UPI0012D47716|nr:uncharacterized protein LOC116346640 isoform X3 [Contarinia nasturtii]